ncbi:hypothetical protein B0H15DRAFT_861931 [Mycena belliarum]|uniref:Uncharacterized protein n=1 Tax=Mycena belliarum TaxID=1033014 RepID=A0AAD6TUY8_9AGAR|nr:hypothetical protein B0H15DRAFT_861931 [Mycena belliae]
MKCGPTPLTPNRAPTPPGNSPSSRPRTSCSPCTQKTTRTRTARVSRLPPFLFRGFFFGGHRLRRGPARSSSMRSDASSVEGVFLTLDFQAPPSTSLSGPRPRTPRPSRAATPPSTPRARSPSRPPPSPSPSPPTCRPSLRRTTGRWSRAPPAPRRSRSSSSRRRTRPRPFRRPRI